MVNSYFSGARPPEGGAFLLPRRRLFPKTVWCSTSWENKHTSWCNRGPGAWPALSAGHRHACGQTHKHNGGFTLWSFQNVSLLKQDRNNRRELSEVTSVFCLFLCPVVFFCDWLLTLFFRRVLDPPRNLKSENLNLNFFLLWDEAVPFTESLLWSHCRLPCWSSCWPPADGAPEVFQVSVRASEFSHPLRYSVVKNQGCNESCFENKASLCRTFRDHEHEGGQWVTLVCMFMIHGSCSRVGEVIYKDSYYNS